MSFIRKLIHFKPQLGHDNCADALIDSWDLIEDA
jgi:hypothetical protein